MDPASSMENAPGPPGGRQRRGVRFPHGFGRRTQRAAHRLHRPSSSAFTHTTTSRITRTRDDRDGRRLTDTRRFAPTSVHLRRNRRSRSPESVFNFNGIRSHQLRWLARLPRPGRPRLWPRPRRPCPRRVHQRHRPYQRHRRLLGPGQGPADPIQGPTETHLPPPSQGDRMAIQPLPRRQVQLPATVPTQEPAQLGMTQELTGQRPVRTCGTLLLDLYYLYVLGGVSPIV